MVLKNYNDLQTPAVKMFTYPVKVQGWHNMRISARSVVKWF